MAFAPPQVTCKAWLFCVLSYLEADQAWTAWWHTELTGVCGLGVLLGFCSWEVLPISLGSPTQGIPPWIWSLGSIDLHVR